MAVAAFTTRAAIAAVATAFAARAAVATVATLTAGTAIAITTITARATAVAAGAAVAAVATVASRLPRRAGVFELGAGFLVNQAHRQADLAARVDLDQLDAIDLRFGYAAPLLIAMVGAILLTAGLEGPRDRS